jgi:SAM-dependent methyltransferase
MMNINKADHEGFNKYYQTVLGSPRARHTFFRRLNAIGDMIGGFENKFVLDVGCGYGFNILISDHNRLSILSETLRKKAFGKDRCETFTKKEVESFFLKNNLKMIRARYIIFTLPFRSMPSWLIRINSFFEYLLERTPLLNTQCGVFVIKGEKI